MVDLRREFEDILKEFGSDYLLVKGNKKQICKCVDTLYKTAKSDCPICLGTGYISLVEKVRGRNIYSNIPETLARTITKNDVGDIISPARRFYIRHNIFLERQDLIIVCGWDKKLPVIDEYTEIYEINHVEPKRADNGRIEYIIASTAMDPVNANAKLHNVVTNAKNVSYYVTVRD